MKTSGVSVRPAHRNHLYDPSWKCWWIIIACRSPIKVGDGGTVWALWDVHQSAKCSDCGCEPRTWLCSTTVWWDSITGLSWSWLLGWIPKLQSQFFLQWLRNGSITIIPSRDRAGITWKIKTAKCNHREHGVLLDLFFFSISLWNRVRSESMVSRWGWGVGWLQSNGRVQVKY